MRWKDDLRHIKLTFIRNNKVMQWGYGIFKLIDGLKTLFWSKRQIIILERTQDMKLQKLTIGGCISW